MGSNEKIPRRPAWIGNYFREAFDAHKRLVGVIHVSRKGIATVTALPTLSRALSKYEGRTEDAQKAKAMEEQAALAKSEVDGDYPALHSFAVVAIWSWLEHLVKGLLVEHLVHDRKTLQFPAFQKIKVRLGDYVSLTKREQASYLVELLERETASSLKSGVNRFESLLDPLNLSGEFDESSSKIIFELQQIRNAIAHQNGRSDRRLKSNCLWLKLRIGEPIAVSSSQLTSYSDVAARYALEIFYRIGDAHGINLRTKSEDI
jgi:hypothetical protein